jgi:hypothetical protein
MGLYGQTLIKITGVQLKQIKFSWSHSIVKAFDYRQKMPGLETLQSNSLKKIKPFFAKSS